LAKDDDTPFHIPIDEGSFDTYMLEPPPDTLEVTKRQLKELYADMWKIRYTA
jgi:hypothetical protein